MRYLISLNVTISYKRSSRSWFVYVTDSRVAASTVGRRSFLFLVQKWFKDDPSGRLSVMALQKKLAAFGLVSSTTVLK